MVMATEPGKQEDAHVEESCLSVPNKINSKCVGNSLSYSQLPADRNGVISRQKLAGSIENHKYDELSTPKLDLVASNGELGVVVDAKSSGSKNEPLNNKPDVSSSHLRQLLLLHLDLIQQQQQQIQEKDNEIVQLKTEKEQLEARIQRMERRMAAKRQNDDCSEETKNAIGSTPGHSKAKTIVHTRKVSISELMRRKSIPAAAPVLMSSVIDNASCTIDSCLRTQTLYLDDEVNILDNNIQENAEELQQLQQQQEEEEQSDVPIPQFRVIENFASPMKTTGTTTRSSVGNVVADPSENLDDEAFSKRHQRYETDEKKRKKWDVQRYRALKQREELQEKYKHREDARLKGTSRMMIGQEEKPDDDSFIPNYLEICAIEMSDTVPVSAFGAPVQSFTSSEFDLPWFSLDKRELQEREKLKSKGRGRRKSCRKTH